MKDAFYIDGLETITPEEEGFYFFNGYFDKKTGEFYYNHNSRRINRINLFTNERLYDGANRKESEEEATYIGGFESNGYIFGTKPANTERFDVYPSKLAMYDTNLALQNYIEISYDLRESLQLVDESHIMLWKKTKYQDKPALQLVK